MSAIEKAKQFVGLGKDEKDKATSLEKTQELPGKEAEMRERPDYLATWHKGSDKLKDKVTLITGGDSGIGRAIAVMFAREGSDIAIVYLPEEQEDADETKMMVEKEGRKCLQLPGDLRDEKFCQEVVNRTVKMYGRIDCLINNAATQTVAKTLEELPMEQVHNTFQTNIISMIALTKFAHPHIPKKTGCIINTTSITAWKGHEVLLDYSSTKGAILAFTRSLADNLAQDGIRVNAVAPGPIWTPLIPASFDKKQLAEFGKKTAMKRPGQPDEVAGAYLFLASQDASYITGTTIHVNGGQIVA